MDDMKKLLLLICVLLPLSVWGADYDFAASDNNGNTLYFSKNTDGQTVTIVASPKKEYQDYTEVSIPDTVQYNNKTYSVTSIMSAAFGGCKKLVSLTLPEGLQRIEKGAFLECKKLTSLKVPSTVRYLSGFDRCTALSEIIIPEGVDTIGDHAFLDCSNLASITLPNGLTTIEDRAFGYCSALTSITIPASVTEIGLQAFDDCPGLQSFYFLPPSPPTITIADVAVLNAAAVVVPAEALADYQTAPVWSNVTSLHADMVTVNTNALFTGLAIYGNTITFYALPQAGLQFMGWSNGTTANLWGLKLNVQWRRVYFAENQCFAEFG